VCTNRLEHDCDDDLHGGQKRGHDRRGGDNPPAEVAPERVDLADAGD
jgi:hypothetical protein